ncbi:hypothetical protein MACJ_001749 [Theileria orientalis]|uniref:Uncharacterized protein n=1 Tax=Theileria orientalis TaxID=68886 RepID=A0A976MBC7_THEOR|nr:hypothetical protein MACJ_001749 [Theileria orientalis]
MPNLVRAALGRNLPQRKWSPRNSEAQILGTASEIRAKGRKQSKEIPKSTCHPEGISREMIGLSERFTRRSTEADPKYRIYYNTVVLELCKIQLNVNTHDYTQEYIYTPKYAHMGIDTSLRVVQNQTLKSTCIQIMDAIDGFNAIATEQKKEIENGNVIPEFRKMASNNETISAIVARATTNKNIIRRTRKLREKNLVDCDRS